MATKRPWITGAALAVTAGLINIACAIAVLLYPDAVLQLGNTWAHGIDLELIRRPADNLLTPAAWASGLVTSTAFAFIVGVVFRWSANRFARLGAPRGSVLRPSPHA